jgi:Ser/Thr protein kinase RdoA (MazF antagonist)
LDELAERASQEFGLGVARRELLQYEDNAVYRLTEHDGSQYVLRVSAEGGCSVAEQTSEVEWLRWLGAGDQPVPNPVATRQGRFVLGVASEAVAQRVCVLFAWLEGDAPASHISEAQMARLGAATADLHARSRHFSPSVDFTRPRLDGSALFAEPGQLASNAPDALLARLGARLGAELDEHSEDNICVIHGDLHRDNVLVRGDAVRFIDFDDCAWGHPLFDVASLLDSFRRRVVAREDYPRMRAAFLEGYRPASGSGVELTRQLCLFKALRDAITLRFITSSSNANVQGWGKARTLQLVRHIEGYLDDGPARI